MKYLNVEFIEHKIIKEDADGSLDLEYIAFKTKAGIMEFEQLGVFLWTGTTDDLKPMYRRELKKGDICDITVDDDGYLSFVYKRPTWKGVRAWD